jgi:hypothetical protein
VITLTRTDGTTVTLRKVGTNAMVALEESLGRPFGTLLLEVGAVSFAQIQLATVRAVLHAAIVSDTPWTLAQVGDLIDDVGIDHVATAINQVTDLTKPVEIKGRRKKR